MLHNYHTQSIGHFAAQIAALHFFFCWFVFAFVKQERFSERDSQIFTESLQLEKASKILKSKLGANPTIPTKCDVNIDPHLEVNRGRKGRKPHRSEALRQEFKLELVTAEF